MSGFPYQERQDRQSGWNHKIENGSCSRRKEAISSRGEPRRPTHGTHLLTQVHTGRIHRFTAGGPTSFLRRRAPGAFFPESSRRLSWRISRHMPVEQLNARVAIAI